MLKFRLLVESVVNKDEVMKIYWIFISILLSLPDLRNLEAHHVWVLLAEGEWYLYVVALLTCMQQCLVVRSVKSVVVPINGFAAKRLIPPIL